MAVHVVKLACQMPDACGRSLSLWDCPELARQLVADGIVEDISPETVRRILRHHKLKPWRHHMWLSPKVPRDEAFRQSVHGICTLYTRPLAPDEMVLCVDEKTSLQPRTRLQPTRAPAPGRPARVEHEYRRSGALNLFAAFDTRTGRVYGQCHKRKRAAEFIAFLTFLDHQISPAVRCVHLVLDNLRTHKTKAIQAWLAAHPRFHLHFTPVHCSWLNQVEQWFATLQRKRFRITDFASLEDLEQKLLCFIAEYNQRAHPYHWTSKSVARVMSLTTQRLRVAA